MIKTISFLLTSVLFLEDMGNYYKKSKFISENDFRDIVKKHDVIYVGEQHDSIGSHKIQLDVIKILHEEKGNKICVGFEMLNSTLQSILDEYIEERITEEEFLNKIDWKKEWGFDFNLYKPIFDYIRENKLKAVALNVPRRIVSKVARKGIDGLDEEERKLIAKEVKVVRHKKYNRYLKHTFYGHGENPMNKIMSFDNYKLAMAVWNESMGEKVVEFLNNNKDYRFVVIAGNGHIMYNAAISWSVKRRINGLRHLTIYTEDSNIKSDEKKLREVSSYADIIAFY